MKLLGALFLVSLAVSNLRTCEAGGKKKANNGVRHAYGKRKQLDESYGQTFDMDHFNVTLENNELLHQLLSLMNSSSRTCTTASETKSNPMDCSDIFDDGQTQSGIYKILPIRDQLNQPLDVLCDMEDGGGWTVFLLRNNASEHVNFTRNWNDYKELFGSAEQEYWIGLENLHALTSSDRTYEVKFEAKAPGKSDTWQGSNFFSVASEDNNYKLTLGEYDVQSSMYSFSGLGHNAGMKFSTYDQDNDPVDGYNCAENHESGWWYNGNSNTKTYPTGIHGEKPGIHIYPWSKQESSRDIFPNWLQIKIRPTTK